MANEIRNTHAHVGAFTIYTPFLIQDKSKKRKNSIIQQMLKNNFGKYFSGS